MKDLGKYPVDRLPRFADGKAYIPLPSQFSPQIVQRVIHLLERAAAKTHLNPARLFERALAFWEATARAPWEVPPDAWLNDLCSGLELGVGLLREAYIEILWQASFNYEDILGGVYAQFCAVGRKRSTQFFTPMHIARAIAEMDLFDLPPRSPGERPYRILDPACGSGVLLLAAAEYIELNWPWMLDHGLISFTGYDIDPVCVAMSRLNDTLHQAGRFIRHMEEVEQSSPGSIEAALRAFFAAGAKGDTFKRIDELSERERGILAKALKSLTPASRDAGKRGHTDTGQQPGAERTRRLFVFDSDPLSGV